MPSEAVLMLTLQVSSSVQKAIRPTMVLLALAPATVTLVPEAGVPTEMAPFFKI